MLSQLDHLGPDLQTFQSDELQRCRCETAEEPKAGSGRTVVRSEPVTRGASGAHQEMFFMDAGGSPEGDIGQVLCF